MTINLKLLAEIRGSISQSGDGGVATFPVVESFAKQVADGTGLGQANAFYLDRFSIAASGTLNIDLTGGTLLDRLNNALVFTALKGILLVADQTNTNDVIYGNGTNPFVGPLSAGSVTHTLKPGNVMQWINLSAAGWAIVADTSDIIKLANSSSGSAVTGTIALIGKV